MKLIIVPARTGLTWVKSGILIFFKQPIALAGLFFMFVACLTLLSQIPVFGTIIAMILLPSFTLGLMSASREAIDGRFPMPFVLFTAFRAGKVQTTAMLILGALYAFGFMSILGLSFLVDDGVFAKVYLGGSLSKSEDINLSSFQAAMWMFVVLHLPLSLMFWHAPALVRWHGASPIKSIFFSGVACWRNVGAFAIFGIAWVGVLVAALFTITTLTSLLGIPGIAAEIIFPLLLLIAAMFFASLYYSFESCFSIEELA